MPEDYVKKPRFPGGAQFFQVLQAFQGRLEFHAAGRQPVSPFVAGRQVQDEGIHAPGQPARQPHVGQGHAVGGKHEGFNAPRFQEFYPALQAGADGRLPAPLQADGAGPGPAEGRAHFSAGHGAPRGRALAIDAGKVAGSRQVHGKLPADDLLLARCLTSSCMHVHGNPPRVPAGKGPAARSGKYREASSVREPPRTVSRL